MCNYWEERKFAEELGIENQTGIAFSPNGDKIAIEDNGKIYVLNGIGTDLLWEVQEDSAFYTKIQEEQKRQAKLKELRANQPKMTQKEPTKTVVETFPERNYCYVASFKKRTNANKLYMVLINVRDFKGSSFSTVMANARGRAKSIAWDNWEAIPLDEEMKEGVTAMTSKGRLLATAEVRLKN